MICDDTKNNILEQDKIQTNSINKNKIQDIGLRTAINKHLNRKILSEITKEDLESLTGILDARDYRIKSLEGIQYACNISCLLLQHNAITDITPLSHLSKLEYLSFNYNHVVKVPSLRSLVNLKKVYCSFNHIIDISSFTEVPNLCSVYGCNQRIKLKHTKVSSDNQVIVAVDSFLDEDSTFKLNECSINPCGIYSQMEQTITIPNASDFEGITFSFEKCYHKKNDGKPFVLSGIVDIPILT